MRKRGFVVTCLLVFHTVVLIGVLHPKDSWGQEGGFPRAFLPKPEGSVTIRRDGESITLWANKSTLEEILERIAVEKKVTLEFYCQDPGLKQERATTLRISATSLEEALRRLLSADHRFTRLNREGKPVGDGRDIAIVNVYPKGCAGSDPPVRIFFAEREYPLLRGLPQEISIEALHDVVKRGGPTYRRRAADILGIKADEKGIAIAMEALKDENPRVMLAAANALKRLGREYGHEKVSDAIYERFREKPYAELLPIMAEVDRDRIWPIIDGLLDQSGEAEKEILTRALVLTNDRRAIGYLSRISSTGSGEISKRAIYGMGKIGGPEAATALVRLLREGGASQQAWAAQVAFFLPKEDALEVRAEVEKVVREERVPDVVLESLAAVSYLEPLELLMKDPALKVELKVRALKALATRESEKTIEVMSIGLNDETPQVRLASVEAMGSLAVQQAIPSLMEATKDKDAKVRQAAIRGLSEFPGNESVVEILGKLTDDLDQSVRREAVDALRFMGEPDAVMIQILLRCRKHEDPYVANKAASIWQYWGL